MTRWAAFSPHVSTRNLLTAMALGASVILLGCGGGGGGGGIPGGGPGGTQVCGSAASSTTVVVCGRVVQDGTGAGIQGAAVTLRNAAGTVLTTGAGAAITATSDASGNYIFTSVPAGAVLFTVDPPAGGTYFTGVARVGGAGTFFYTLSNQAGNGKCYPALAKGGGALPAGDTKISDVSLFPQAAPPPPAFGCPR